MLRLARSSDIGIVHALLVAEAEQGCFDRRLAEQPYRDGLRRNLNHIRKRGRRLDEEVSAELLVWEQEGEVAACIINSAILSQSGNELWMVAVKPECRGRGIGREMVNAVLAHLHPRVDIFARCAAEADLSYSMFLRRGFLPLDATDKGIRILKLPKMGMPLSGQGSAQQSLEPFVEIAEML